MKKLAAVAGVVGGLAGGADAAAPRFEALVVFGDSLSDNGNAGRFSNGKVWVEHLAERLGLALAPVRFGGTNLAVGGARAIGGGFFDLPSQTQFFLQRGGADADSLYVVYAGGNDLRADADPSRAAGAVAAAVERLAKAGARHLLVPNLGDLGVTPDYRQRGEAARGRAQTEAFNAALARALDAVEARHEVRIYRLDVFTLGDSVSVGFVDAVHPDARAHATLGAAAHAVVTR